jgi:hypothetical protein
MREIAVQVSTIVAASVLGALVGIAVSGPAGAILGVVPPTVIAVWQTIDGHVRGQGVRDQLALLRAHTPITSIERHHAAEEALQVQTSILTSAGRGEGPY